ncbi:MAG: ABC transporter ATP-binding protein [Candidatus Andersenbacteria bacterium]|nr:ABC transporter ATP-binding protein [Candidatus Andersenbacteria bacterium]MBI3250891.1 ABC transporter ATP-binding protein [Candidatus Andersenbacteria bacterium]
MKAVEVHNLTKVFVPHNSWPWSKNFPVTTALQDVSFSLEQGKTLGIMGANGSGKSTLLRILAGILQPTKGTVSTTGNVAAVIDMSACFHNDLTVQDNIALYSELSGAGKVLRSQSADIISFAELETYERRPLRELSRGMKTRLVFSTVIRVPADIYLFDEAFSGGDERFKKRAQDRIKKLQTEGKTLVMASHRPVFLKQVASLGLVLDQGRLAFYGPLAEAIPPYRKLLGI